MTGDKQMVNAIQDSGAESSIVDDNGQSALDLAEQNRSVDIAQRLRNHRGVVRSEDGASSSELAVDTDRIVSKRFMTGVTAMTKGKAVAPILLGCEESKMDEQPLETPLVEKWNSCGFDMETELYFMMKTALGEEEVGDGNRERGGVQALLHLGASVKYKDGRSWKALHVAVECESILMCRLRLSAGVKSNGLNLALR